MHGRHGWFAGLLLAAPLAQAQFPLQPQAPSPLLPFGRAMTVEALDQNLDTMRRIAWEMPAGLGNPPADDGGRRVDDDLADYFLTEPVLARLQAMRDAIAASTAPGAEIPAAMLAPLTQLQDSQGCRIGVIGNYWHRRQSHDYHRDMILRLVERLPEADQAAAKSELQALDAAANTARAQIAPGLQYCDLQEHASSVASTPRLLQMDTSEAGYNALRLKVVAQLRVAQGDAGREGMTMHRSTPCPAPAEVASGTHGLKLRITPDIRDYYPSEAILLGIDGDGKVRLHYDETGCVVEATVVESTGAELLDVAALRIALDYALTPAATDGKAVAGGALLPIHFSVHSMAALRQASRSALRSSRS